MKRIAATITVLLLALCGTAQARTYEGVVARSQSIAESYWQTRGVEPCGPVTIEIDTIVFGDELGTGNQGTCILTLAPALRGDMTVPRYICGVVVHEYGHLAGLGHSTDPASVMYPQVLTPPAECTRAWPKHHRRPRSSRG